MAEELQIPGYAVALASERRDRALAILGLPQAICGVKVQPFTPWRLEWLRLQDNPFIVGGYSEPTPAEMLQFLWVVADGTGEAMALETFVETHATLNADELRAGIDAYLDRAFLDSPRGASSTPYFAPTISYYHSLVISYPCGGWTLEKVSDTPLAVIFQLLKADDRYNGRVVFNGRSDKVSGDWLDEQNTPELIAARLAEQRRMFAEHFAPTPEIKPTPQRPVWEFAI